MRPLLSSLLTLLVSLQHIYIFTLEALLWTSPLGLRTFRMTPSYAASTRVLAANQGLYNLFLAAGLGWSLVHAEPSVGWELKVFFLGCVLLAACFGGVTVGRRLFIVQGLPAGCAMGLLMLGF